MPIIINQTNTMQKLHLNLLFCFLTFQSYAQQTIGLLFNDSLAFNGYTLLAPISAQSTYLIDNCGRVVNSWTSDHVPYFSARLTPEGNLLRAVRFNADGTAAELHHLSLIHI